MIHTGRTKSCLVTIGDYAVGKTTLIKALSNAPFSPDEPTTIGVDPFQITLTHEDQALELVVWDTAGQERFKSLVPIYSRRSDAALIVFDMTSLETFKGIEEKIQSFVKISESHKLVFIVGTKMDLTAEFEVRELDAQRWADSHDLPIAFTSAKTGQGMPEFKRRLAAKLANMSHDSPVQFELDPAQGKKDGCC
jgi:small GTP-binding protein